MAQTHPHLPSSISSDLPQELAELATEYLTPSARRSLFRATRTFGQLPTAALVTRLRLNTAHLGSIVLLPGPHTTHTQCQLTRVTTLELSPAPETEAGLAGSGGDASMPEQLQHAHRFLTACLLTTLRQLNCLLLAHLPSSSVPALVACLSAAAPPSLTCLGLRDLQDDVGRGAPEDAAYPLWQSLASLSILRRLELAGALTGAQHVEGLGGMLQLRSLSLQCDGLKLSALPHLAALTQLELLSPPVAEYDAPGLAAYSGLQDLNLDHPPSHIAWAALGRLTSLRTARHPRGYVPSVALAACTALVRLSTADTTFPCALLLPLMHALEDLECGDVVLPTLGAGVLSQRLRRLTAMAFKSVLDEHGDPVPPQAVPYTFPCLEALRLRYLLLEHKAPATNLLWPEGPASHMKHLRTLSTRLYSGGLPLPLARAAVAVTELHLSSLYCRMWHFADMLPALWVFGSRVWRASLKDCRYNHIIGSLVACWPRLQHLELRSGRVGNAGLAVLGRALCLRTVTLDDCSQVDAAGVAALASHPVIQLITVRRCPRLLEGDVNAILAALKRPWLTIDLR